jgi:hypothetical protein
VTFISILPTGTLAWLSICAARASNRVIARHSGTWSRPSQLLPVPEQQAVLKRIRKLAGEGLSPRKISADIAERGVKLSHVTVGKIIAGRAAA